MRTWITFIAAALTTVLSHAQDFDNSHCEALQTLDLRGSVERSYLDRGVRVGETSTERFEIVKSPYRWKSLNNVIARIRAEGAAVITPVFQGDRLAVLGVRDPSILKACVLMFISAEDHQYPLPLYLKRVQVKEVEAMVEGPERTLVLKAIN